MERDVTPIPIWNVLPINQMKKKGRIFAKVLSSELAPDYKVSPTI